MLPTSGQVCGTAVLDQTPLIERVPFLQEIKKCALTQRCTRNLPAAAAKKQVQ